MSNKILEEIEKSIAAYNTPELNGTTKAQAPATKENASNAYRINTIPSSQNNVLGEIGKSVAAFNNSKLNGTNGWKMKSYTKNPQTKAKKSVVSYDQGGKVNAWQTALNVLNGIDSAKVKALSNQKYSDRFNEEVLKEYTARGGKTFLGKAMNANLYKQIEDELTPNYAPAQTSYERAKLPASMARDSIVENAQAAQYLADYYENPTVAIEGSRTRGNTLDYLQKYENMGFGEKLANTAGNAVVNYGLDLSNTLLTGADALTGGKLSNGNSKAASIYSALNFAQNAGSGLTSQAYNSMRESSNWLGKLILDLEKTSVEQLLDRAFSAFGMNGANSLVSMGARVFGSGAQEAENEGKSLREQLLTGGIRSGIEIGTELLGGVGGSWRGTGYGDAVFNSLDKWVGTKTNKEMLGTLASAFGSEATEEMLSDILNPLADRIFNISNGDQTFWQEVWGDGQILYDGLLGGLAGLGGGLGTSFSNASAAKYFGVDVATYKAAQRIAGDKKLRKKYEKYTGEHLQENESTSIMQIAVGLTETAEKTDSTTRALENDIRQYKAEPHGTQSATTPAALSTSQTDTSTLAAANVAQNASESPTTNESARTSTNTTPAQNYSQSTIQAKAAALGDMTAIYNGAEARVTSMVKMDNGKYAAQIEYPTSKGIKKRQLTEDKLTFDPETKRLINMFRPYEYSSEMLFNYDAQKDGGENLAAYTMAFNTVADILGKQTTLSEEAAKQYVQGEPGLASTLSEEQITAAFRAGRKSKDARVQSSVTRKGGTGKLVFGKSITVQGMQYQAATEDMVSQAEREVLQTVAKAAGVDIFFYQSEEAEGIYQGANGFYRNGTVYLDVNAGAERTTEQSAILLTAAHELTHYLRENNAEGYAELRDFVTTHLIQDGTDIVTLAEQKIRNEGGENYADFTLEDAIEEVVADSCEMMLENTQLPQIMAQENPDLYSKVRGWLRKFVENLRRAFEGVTARSPEARAMVQYAGELQQIWDNALADTALKPREKRGASGSTKYSYAGRNASTANMETLSKAEELERNGEDWNTIRNETGWFRGMDNKWRYEINDSNMEFRKGGDVQLLAEPEYQQLIDLTDKWAASFDGGEALTEAEENEMTRLKEKYGAEVWEDKYMLRDFVKHDELFEAYPRLNSVGLQFDELPDGVKGYYSKRGNTIILNESLFGKEPDVVLHEIQHIIQKIEGFTGGASVEYWEEQMKNGYSKRGSRESDMMPGELYRNTAGEIEARDTASRRKLTAEERRSNAPVRADENTVFADDERSYSVRNYKGNRIVWIDTDITKQKPSDVPIQDYVQRYISDMAYDRSDFLATLPESGINVYAEKKGRTPKSKYGLAEEYVRSTYSRWLKDNSKSAFRAKMKAAGVLDELVSIATGRKWSETEHSHNKDARYGVDTYRSSFAFPVKDNMGKLANVRAYDCKLIVLNASDGKKYLYDVTGIKENTSKAKDVLLSERQRAAYRAARQTDVVNNISQPGEEVNSKFSRRAADDTMTKEQVREQQISRAELLRENEALRQRAEYWKGQTQLTKEKTVRNTDTHKFARDMAEKLDVKNREAVAEFEDAAQHMGNYIVQSDSETLDYDTLHTMASETADILLSNSEVEVESGMEEQLGELADYIKTHKLKVNETELKDLPKEWLRQHRRFIKLSSDGTPIDVAWQEWQEQFGEGMFPSDITAQSDMLQRLADIEQGWRTYKANPFENNMAEMREIVAQEIIDTMLSDEIRQTAPTAADRAKAKADKRYSDMRQAERQRANERIAKVLEEGKQRTKDAVKAERTFQLQRVERIQKMNSIKKLRDRMIKSLTDNTGKNHVPDILKEPVAQLLQSIDPTTKRTRQAGTKLYVESLEKLQRVLEQQRKHNAHTLDENEAEGEGADLFFDIPVEFTEQIQDYVDNVKHWGEFSKTTTFKLEDMSLQGLNDLENILRVVRGAVNNVNELYDMNTTASELGNETINYLAEMKEKTKVTGGMEKFLGFSNQTPVYYFERFGEAGKKVMKSLTDGWDKFAFYTDEILSFAKNLYSTKEVRKAERDIRIVQLHETLADGLTDSVTVPVSMTRAQIMNLYGAARRGEASLNHILGAGIEITAIKPKVGKATAQSKTYLFEDIYELAQIINDNLTARDKQIVDAMISFMSGPVAKWGNAVSQERWGIDLFTEENYWPIITTRNSHNVSNSDSAGASTSIYRLMNMGFTKKLTPGANNPVVIGSAFDVFANHTSDMAKYGSMVLPILNTMKWINYSSATGNRTLQAGIDSASPGKAYSQYTTVSVRKSMDSIYGREAQDYLVQLLRDLNGQSGGISSVDFVDTLTSNYKRQAVAANLRVALLQPTSIIRAFHVLESNGLSMDTLRSFAVKKNYEEAKANSGIALWKDLGFYDTNINASVRKQIKHDESFIDNLVDKSMFLAEKGDRLTWSILWGASRHQVKQEAAKVGQKLTHEELMQKTNELFTTVIYKTQVVDSPLTRSQLMRNNDKLSKALTAFMAEPTLSYNVLAENVHEFARETSAHDIPTAWKKCGKKILRSLVIYSASAILTAAAASLADAGRDDDEYKKLWQKWLEKFKGEESFWDSNIWAELNPLTKLPAIKDIFNLIAGQTSSNMWLEGFDSAYSAVKSIYERIGEKDDLFRLEMKDWQVAYRGLKAASQLAGLPLMTFTRDAVGLWNTTVGAFTGKYIHNYDYDQEKAIRNAYRSGYLDEEQAMNLLMDRDTMGDNVYFTEHAAQVKIADWTNDSIEAMYDSLYTAMENDDRAGFNAAMESLVKDGKRYHYDVIGNVRSTIKEWYIGDEHGAYKLNRDMAVDMLTDYGGYTTDDAKKTVHQWTCEKVEGFSYTNRKELFLLGDITRDEAIKLVMAYGKDDDGKLLSDYEDKSAAREAAEKEVQTWQMALDTKIDYEKIRSAYDAGEISEAQLKEYLMTYGSLEEESAENKAYLWQWKEGDDKLGSITSAQARRYDNYIVGAGVDITKEQYANFIDGNLASEFSGDLKPGSTTSYIPYSKRNKIWAYIDTLPLTPEEKDAMAVVYAYDNNPDTSANSSYFDLQEAPWNN